MMISISKIKKIIASKKKWIENGNRFFDIELNPHSNEDIFWKFILDFFLITKIIIFNVEIIIIIEIINFNIKFIIHLIY